MDIHHDEINLIRLVRRIEKSVAEEQDWDDAAASQQEQVWLKALGILQKIKYGRKLLSNLQEYGVTPSLKKERQRADIVLKLDRIEIFMQEVQKRTEPSQPKFESILSKIPPPALPTSGNQLESTPFSEQGGEEKLEDGTQIPQPEDNISEPSSHRSSISRNQPQILTSSTIPNDESSLSSSLLPATPTPENSRSAFPTAISSAIDNSSSSTVIPRSHAKASAALHEELSNQLAQMATQLKQNAMHFSNSLQRDKTVVEEAQEKLEANFGTMLKERLRLRDFRGKSKNSTWLTLGIVLLVLLIFVAMVGVVRFSRR